MPPYKLSSDDAFQLSKSFRETGVALGDYRFANWSSLKPSQRKSLEDAEWSLLNAASDMTTAAVGLVLDESEADLQDVQKATAKAKAAVKTLKTVAKVIKVGTAAVGLAAAIVARDPGAIATNAKAVYDAASADA